MLAEDHVRRLLAEAATTITPGPEPEVRLPTHRWRAPLAATAAVVLIAGGITAASLRQGGAPAPPTPTPSPTIDAYAGDTSFHLGPDQIPPVAGYPTAVARRLLEQHGWTVSVQPEPGCTVGTAATTSPPMGTPSAPGSEIVLSVSARQQPHDPDCRALTGNGDPFLLWVEGLGPAPRFADTVTYRVPARGITLALPAPQATDRAHWPYLGTLASEATGVSVLVTVSGLMFHANTVADASRCPPGGGLCLGPHRLRVISGFASVMTASYTTTADGAIDSVTLGEARTPRTLSSPEVVGDSASYATLRLRAWGYHVTPLYRVDCAPPGVVSRIAFRSSQAFIGVTQSTGQCDSWPLQSPGHRVRPRSTSPARAAPSGGVDHYRRTAASAFIAFAHGRSGGPAWADRVAYEIDGRRVKTLTVVQAQRRSSWNACPAGSPPGTCPLSPLAAVRALGRYGARPRIAVPPAYSLCLPPPGRLPATPPDLRAATIAAGAAHPACASDAFVTLALDDDDRVASVDLTLPRR